MIQNNLGLALLRLGEVEGSAARYEEAITPRRRNGHVEGPDRLRLDRRMDADLHDGSQRSEVFTGDLL
jgi:hypothetical protein